VYTNAATEKGDVTLTSNLISTLLITLQLYDVVSLRHTKINEVVDTLSR
jgi:hypothetical protein